MRHWIRLLMFLLMLALPFQQAAAALSCCPANACGHGAAAQAATAKTHSSATLDMALATAPPGHLTPLAAHLCLTCCTACIPPLFAAVAGTVLHPRKVTAVVYAQASIRFKNHIPLGLDRPPILST